MSDGVDGAFPSGDKENLVAGGITEDVVNVFDAVEFIKTWTPRIGPADSAGIKKKPEFEELLRSVIPDVLHDWRQFLNSCHDRIPLQPLKHT